jgi:hypothetical protein
MQKIRLSWSPHKMGNNLEFVSVALFQIRSFIRASASYYYYRYSAFRPVWAETRAQSGDWYGSGMLHPGQILRGNLPLLSPFSQHCLLNSRHSSGGGSLSMNVTVNRRNGCSSLFDPDYKSTVLSRHRIRSTG